ncbi:MAG: hypothetical protein J6Y07_03545 [Alphaproteobacteria bacterium]|nr:hypothetical protein [Alphaproteobacteria bacterium]
MKLKTSIILCSLATVMATPAMANSVWDLYAGVSVGVGAQTLFGDGKNETGTAQSFGAMFGLDVPLFRGEVEYTYINESDSHASIGFANAYFKMPSTVIRPYFGLGVGVMFNGEENAKYNKKFDTKPAYQGMLGVTIDVPKLPFKFDVEAHAIYIPDVLRFGNERPDILHYEARIKLRYIF